MMASTQQPNQDAQMSPAPPPYLAESSPVQVQQQQQQIPIIQVQNTSIPPPPSRARRSTRGREVIAAPSDITPPLPTKMRPANPNHTLVAMVVDRSGSMQTMGAEVHGGCNAYLDECRKGDVEDTTTTSVIFTRFDNVAECVYENVPLVDGIEISAEDVKPRGSTALYDAIGVTLQKTAKTLEELPFVPKVVFFVLTDGQENASQKWTKAQVTKQIKKLQEKPFEWDFYFAAANQDAMAEGHAIGVDRSTCMTYSSSPRAMSEAFKSQAQAHGRRKKGMSKGYLMAERSACLD